MTHRWSPDRDIGAPIAENGTRLITQAELLAHAVDVDRSKLTAANLTIA